MADRTPRRPNPNDRDPIRELIEATRSEIEALIDPEAEWARFTALGPTADTRTEPAVADDPEPRTRRWTWAAAAAAAILALVGSVAFLRRSDSAESVALSSPDADSAPDTTTAIGSGAATTSPATTTTAAAATTSTAATSTTVADELSTNPNIPRAVEGLVTYSGSSIIDAALVSTDAGWVVTDRMIAVTDAAGVVRGSRELPSIDGDLGPGVQALIDRDHAVVARTDTTTGRVVVIGTETGLADSFATEIDAGLGRSQPLGIAFADELHGWVTVGDADSEQTVGGRGVLYRTTDGGRSFERIADDAPSPLAFVDGQIGWASGSGLFLTRDGGSSWTRLTPPNWDASGPAAGGPSYEVVAATHARTLIRQQAPTGTMTQVHYYATDDLGATWRDITPPGTAEVSNTGPQTWLASPSADHIVGIAQRMGPLPSAVWLESSDAGHTYSSSAIAIAAVDVTMYDDRDGWIRTPTGLHHTIDGGRTWTWSASTIAPFDTEPGCTWQPELRSQEGAGQWDNTVVAYENVGSRECDWPEITSGTAGSLIDGTDLELSHAGDATSSRSVLPGDAVEIWLSSIVYFGNCGDPPATASLPISGIRFELGDVTSSPLPVVLDGACGVSYRVVPDRTDG